MGDNGKEIPVNQDEKKDLPSEEIKLIIVAKPDGKIDVTGPIMNEMLCFYLLEKAKDIIKSFNIQRAQPKIVPANHGIMNFARRFK